MNRILRLLRSLGPDGALANARRACEELHLRDRHAAAIERRFAAMEPARAGGATAHAHRQVA